MAVNANVIEIVLSLANRPFQEAKVNGKTICSGCFHNTNDIKFFMEDNDSQLVLDEGITKHCKMFFQNLHGQETSKILKQLSALRLNTVRMYFAIIYVCNLLYKVLFNRSFQTNISFNNLHVLCLL